MREIKFRGWDGRKMHYDGFAIDPQGGTIDSWDEATVYPKVLMQFTGLKDSKGKDVYEGDIVKKYDIVRKLEGMFEVYWREDRWHLKDRNGEGYDNGDYYNGDEITWEPHTTVFGMSQDGVEVIGNIYENPTLLDTPTVNPT